MPWYCIYWLAGTWSGAEPSFMLSLICAFSAVCVLLKKHGTNKTMKCVCSATTSQSEKIQYSLKMFMELLVTYVYVKLHAAMLN